MSEPTKAARVVGSLSGLAQIAVMTWAALSTGGALSVVLWAFVALCATGLAVRNV